MEIDCDGSVPPGEPQESIVSGKMRIILNPLDDWQRDSGFCRKLITKLLRAKSGNINGNLSQLPDWFIYGIAQIAAEQTASARLVRNQHSFELLNLLAENGTFGNPADILDLKRSSLSSEEEKFFLEYAKLLMLTLGRRRCFAELTAHISYSARFDADKFNAAARKSLKQLDEKMISPFYRRELWSDLTPPPEKFTRMALEYAFITDIPELDEEGLPTGKILKVHIVDLPALADRPDFLLICRRISSKLFAVSSGESREVRTLLANIRYIFESDIQRLTEVQQSGEVQAGGINVRHAKPLAAKNSKPAVNNLESDLNKLLQNSQNSDFRKNVRSFYKEKVISSDSKSAGGQIVSGFNRMFNSGTQIDADVIKKYVAEIYSAVDKRTEIRAFVIGEEEKIRSIPSWIENRRRSIYGGNSRHAAFLESVSNNLY